MKRIVSLAVLVAGMTAFADEAQQKIDLTFTSPGAQVQPFTKHVVLGGPDGELYDIEGRLWPRLEAIAMANGITNMLWVADVYTNALFGAINELTSVTNSLPSTGILLGLRFPLDNTSHRDVIEGYVVQQGTDSLNGYDWLDIHFTQNVSEPTVVLDYVYEGGGTNTVTGAWKVSQYNANWTNVTSVTWRDFTYDNVHRCYFRRPAEAAGMPLVVNPHLKWRLSTWGSTLITVNGKTALDGTVLNRDTGAYRTYYRGFRMAPAYQYLEVEELAQRLSTVGKEPADKPKKKRFGLEHYK